MPKILAIDDNSDNLISLKAIMDDAFPGSIVFTAINGSKGIELAIANNPDVILLDIIMPGMDGFEVCRLLKLDERVHDIPVVFLTALKGDKENRIKALEVGAEGFLSKPIDEIELIAQIRAMVKIKAANEQKRDEKEKLEKLVDERTNELVQSQAMLKGIFENLQDAYFRADLTGKFTLISPSAIRLYGYNSIDELIGQQAEILYYDPKERVSLFSRLRSESQVLDFVGRGKKKNGTAFWVSMNVRLLHSDDGRVIGSEGVVRDITERIETEGALKESEEKYRLMVDLLPDAVIIHEGGKFIFANAAALKTVGADSFEQLIERSLMDYVHPDFRKNALERITQIYSTGQPSTFSEEKFVTLKDEIIYVEVIGIPIEYMGKPAIQTIIRDVTERRKAELAVQKSEAQFREFFEKAADAIFIAEIESEIIVDANKAASRLTLRPHNELVGIHQSELHPPIKEDYTKDSFKKHKELVKNKVSSYAVENSVVRADGTEVPVEILASEVIFQGKPCLMGTFRDITERKRISEALKNSLSLTESTLESIHNGILVVDHDGKVIKTSSQFAEMWHIPQDIIATGDDKILMNYILDQLTNPDEFVSKVMELYAKYESESTDLVYFNDGRVFERVSKPMHLEGKHNGRVWSFLDITERKRSEEKLRENAARLELAMSTAKMSWWEMDITTGNVVFEKQKAEMLGYSPEKFKHYNDFMALVHPEDYERTMDAMKSHLDGSSDKYEVEYRIKTFLGEYKWFYDIGSVTKRDSEGRPHIVSGLVLNMTERKHAEEARKESYEFNKSLLKTIPFGMDIVDEYGNILFQNENFENVFGKNTVGRKCWELYREDKCQCFDCPLHKGIKIGETATYESSGILGGRIFEISHTGMIFKGKKAMLEIFQDITDRKLAEEEMKRAKKLLEQTFEQSPVPMVLVSMPDMMIRIVNPACRSFLGIDDEASVINTLLKEINPTWQDYDVNGKQTDFEDIPLPKSLMGKQTIGEERQIVRKDGTIRYNLASAFPIYNDQNKIIAGTLFMSDITDMKQAQKAALESVKLFRDLFNASPDAILLIDTNHPTISWPIIDCNEAACRMNGYTREEMIGQPIDLLHTNITTQEEHDAYFNNLKEEGILCRENVHRHKDGHSFPIETSNTIVVIGGHQMVLGIDRDITDRKQAEIELIEKNTFIQTIMDNLPIGLALNSIDNGNAMYMNKKFEEIYGWPSLEIKNISDFFQNVYPDEKYRNELISTTMEDMQSGDPSRMHWENCFITHKDRSLHYVNAVNIPLYDQNTMVSTVVDITEMKQTEISLKESEDRYRQFISQVSEGVYRFECDQPLDINLPIEEQVDFIYDHMFVAECNETLLKMYGFKDRNEIIGKSHLYFHGSRDNRVSRDSLIEFIKNDYRIENALTEEINQLGKLMYFSNNTMGIVENNQLIRIWGTQIDMTEKIHADKVQQVLYTISKATLSAIDLTELIEVISNELGKLLDSTNFFIAFYDEGTNTLSTIYEKDEKDVMQTWSADKSMTGFVIRNQKSILIHEPEVRQLIDSGELENFGTPSKVWLGVPLKLNKKVIGAIVVQSYDNPEAFNEKDKLMLEFISHQICISIERKKAEQELNEALVKAQESDRLKSAFLANMSHEIRTPLNSIIGFSDLLFDQDFDEDQKKSFAENISMSGNGLLAIINDIMDLSKIETGQIQVNKSTFSINRLIRDIQKEFSFKTSEKGIELRIDPLNPIEEIFIDTDQTKLRQVLINFVANALKFTETGFIEMGIRDRGESVYVQVKDSGIGIPEEYHGKIFERFRQVESSDSRKYGGNGLGLAISKSLIEILGGDIGLESVQGSGSTFYFTIPKQA